jgi:hypothetical protein
MVILYEVDVNTGLRKHIRSIGFYEEPPGIVNDFRLDQNYAGK